MLFRNACKHAYAVNDSITVADNTCEHWRKKQEEEYDLSARRFDEAEEDIQRLMMMFGDRD